MVLRHRDLSWIVRFIHDVSAAALSDTPAHHGRRLLLQFRPDRRRAGIVFFGLFSKVGDQRLAMFYAAFLFLPRRELP